MLLSGFQPTFVTEECTMAASNVFQRFVGGQLEVIDPHGKVLTCGEINNVSVNGMLATIQLRWNARPIGRFTEDLWEVGGNTTLYIDLNHQVITPHGSSRSYASQGMRMVFHPKEHPVLNPSKVAGLTPA